MNLDEMVHVRYMVDDVEDSIAFYTTFLDFEVLSNAAPAFADVRRGNLRLLLAGPTSSAGRPMTDGVKPGPGGWNRIHFHVEDIDAEVARAARRRGRVPQRHRRRSGWQADPAPRSVREHRRAVPTGCVVTHPMNEADAALQWLTEQFAWEHTLSALLGVDLDVTDWAKGRPRQRRMADDQIVNVRYLVDDVDEAVDFYTEILGFELLTIAVPAFADVKRGNLRLLLAGPTCAARLPMPDGAVPRPGRLEPPALRRRRHRGRSGPAAYVQRPIRRRHRAEPGGKQILLHDPSGNIIELFEPAA